MHFPYEGIKNYVLLSELRESSYHRFWTLEYFLGRYSTLQKQQYTLQPTGFLLATLHSEGVQCTSPTRASKHTLSFEIPSHRM